MNFFKLPGIALRTIERDGAYHHEMAWSWLTGYFMNTRLTITDDFSPFEIFRTTENHFKEHGLEAIGKVFDGQAPYYFSVQGTADVSPAK